MITAIQNTNISNPNITYGYMDLKKREKKQYQPDTTFKDKTLSAVGSITGVGLTMAYLMQKQKITNPLKLKINKVSTMIPMAAAANIGAILLSSFKERKEDIKNKWKEGAFQMLLTATPMLLVDNTIKFCEKSENKLINNSASKLGISAVGVFIGSHLALAVSNKLRNEFETKKKQRELKPIDMIANLDDAVAMMVLAKVPFANKINIDKLLPFIYTFCGYRSGTGDKR